MPQLLQRNLMKLPLQTPSLVFDPPGLVCRRKRRNCSQAGLKSWKVRSGSMPNEVEVRITLITARHKRPCQLSASAPELFFRRIGNRLPEGSKLLHDWIYRHPPI